MPMCRRQYPAQFRSELPNLVFATDICARGASISRPPGEMASRLTTNQEIAGSTPAVVISFCFLFISIPRFRCTHHAFNSSPPFVSPVALNRATRHCVRVPRARAAHQTPLHVTHACGRQLRRRHRPDWLVVGPLRNKPSYSCVSCNVQSPFRPSTQILPVASPRARVQPLQLLLSTTPPLQSHPAWAAGTQPTGAACASSPNAKPKRERWAPRTYASSRASCTGTPTARQRPTRLFPAGALPKTSALAATRNYTPQPP